MHTRTVAYGPDFDHYELHECIRCFCRGWYSEYDDEQGHRHYQFPAKWLEVSRIAHTAGK